MNLSKHHTATLPELGVPFDWGRLVQVPYLGRIRPVRLVRHSGLKLN
jgi:hypothetical protein